jgi:LmbE family N-acetylglucosaminyl deacetylase
VTPERILVLAPHTDDGEFGCGGTLARFIEEGAETRCTAFSAAEISIPDGFPSGVLHDEIRAATASLGIEQLDVLDFPVREFPRYRQEILEWLVAVEREWKPDLVLQPSCHDVHQDHQVIAQEGLRAFKHTTVLGYELPWNNYRFDFQAFVALGREHVARKITAVALYESQAHRPYADPAFLEAQARVHGVQAGAEFAEAFEVVRAVL